MQERARKYDILRFRRTVCASIYKVGKLSQQIAERHYFVATLSGKKERETERKGVRGKDEKEEVWDKKGEEGRVAVTSAPLELSQDRRWKFRRRESAIDAKELLTALRATANSSPGKLKHRGYLRTIDNGNVINRPGRRRARRRAFGLTIWHWLITLTDIAGARNRVRPRVLCRGGIEFAAPNSIRTNCSSTFLPPPLPLYTLCEPTARAVLPLIGERSPSPLSTAAFRRFPIALPLFIRR